MTDTKPKEADEVQDFDLDSIVLIEESAYNTAFREGLRAGAKEVSATAFSTANQVASKGTSTLWYYQTLASTLLPHLQSQADDALTQEDKAIIALLKDILKLAGKATANENEHQDEVESIMKSICAKIEVANSKKLLKGKYKILRKYDGTTVKIDFDF